MEGRGAVPPGILTLTTGLSKPFMRLDKYPNLLKELERHMEVCIETSAAKHLRIGVWSTAYVFIFVPSGESPRPTRHSEVHGVL